MDSVITELTLDPTNLSTSAKQDTLLAAVATSARQDTLQATAEALSTATKQDTHQSAWLRRMQPALGVAQDVAIGVAHAESAPVGATLIRVVATVACRMVIGAAPAAGAANDTYLPAGVVEYFTCGLTNLVSVIRTAGDGILNITPIA